MFYSRSIPMAGQLAALRVWALLWGKYCRPRPHHHCCSLRSRKHARLLQGTSRMILSTWNVKNLKNKRKEALSIAKHVSVHHRSVLDLTTLILSWIQLNAETSSPLVGTRTFPGIYVYRNEQSPPVFVTPPPRPKKKKKREADIHFSLLFFILFKERVVLTMTLHGFFLLTLWTWVTTELVWSSYQRPDRLHPLKLVISIRTW